MTLEKLVLLRYLRRKFNDMPGIDCPLHFYADHLISVTGRVVLGADNQTTSLLRASVDSLDDVD